MRVIGTAGHVDHGKSTLIEALTGTHPDRLKEEREREMTIDLGFAWMGLPNGEEVGIIDVPGHRDFIENMLAGVGGIDAALFVIAADEGIMPQTREHLTILDLLQIQGGVVALTKIDLVQDPEWLDLIEEDIKQVLNGTVMGGASIVRVSARQKLGLDELKLALVACLTGIQERLDLKRARLPVDRVFTIAGFGTVVTGTLSDGVLKVGEEIELLPNGLHGRVRGLQTHKRKEELALPGSRTAVNISSIALELVRRGDVVCQPGMYLPTQRIDVSFRLLKDASQPLKHNTPVKIFIGTAEVPGRVRLLGKEEMAQGETGFLQIELEQPIVTVRGDRYILRRPSPGETLGGGKVIDPFPTSRHKRHAQDVLNRLETLSAGTPEEILSASIIRSGTGSIKEVLASSGLEQTQAMETINQLIDRGEVILLEGEKTIPSSNNLETLIASRQYWETLTRQISDTLDRFHKENPLRRGMPREELKSRLKQTIRYFNLVVTRLVEEGMLVEVGNQVAAPQHRVVFSAQQEKLKKDLLGLFEKTPYSPPSVKECQAQVGDELYNALLEMGELVQVSPEVVFEQKAYEKLLNGVKALIHQKGEASAAEVRDQFNTSRKYALALLEYLDKMGVTVREGDVRRLK
jgi:selenocysteine-specific elongation factor